MSLTLHFPNGETLSLSVRQLEQSEYFRSLVETGESDHDLPFSGVQQELIVAYFKGNYPLAIRKARELGVQETLELLYGYLSISTFAPEFADPFDAENYPVNKQLFFAPIALAEVPLTDLYEYVDDYPLTLTELFGFFRPADFRPYYFYRAGKLRFVLIDEVAYHLDHQGRLYAYQENTVIELPTPTRLIQITRARNALIALAENGVVYRWENEAWEIVPAPILFASLGVGKATRLFIAKDQDGKFWVYDQTFQELPEIPDAIELFMYRNGRRLTTYYLTTKNELYYRSEYTDPASSKLLGTDVLHIQASPDHSLGIFAWTTDGKLKIYDLRGDRSRTESKLVEYRDQGYLTLNKDGTLIGTRSRLIGENVACYDYYPAANDNNRGRPIHNVFFLLKKDDTVEVKRM